MEMRQIIEKEGSIYALGADNMIYRWNHEGKWDPFWDTRTPEEKEEARIRLANQLNERPDTGLV
jgi:hypothetical protein